MNTTVLLALFLISSPPLLEWSPVVLRSYVNSDIPRSYADQEVWQGKGLTQQAGIGVKAAWWIFETRLKSSWVYSQNLETSEFPMDGLSTSALSQISLYRYLIDYPDRHSETSWNRFHINGSYVRLNLWRASVGVSTENHWWGPGVRNSIMMGHQAPGFKHIYLKTNAPIPIGIGSVEFTYLGGQLEDTDIGRDGRNGEWVYLSGLNAGYSPRFFPGLTLGISRSFIANGSDLITWSDYVPILQPFDKSKLGAGTDGGGSQPDDQRASVFFSWKIREGAFRVYGEFGKEDHNADIRDIIGEPEHNRAYQFGLEIRSVVSRGRLTSGFELTHLTMSNSRQTRSSGIWYTHTFVRQGYTNQGQLLGAAIGPGSSSQTIWATLESDTYSVGGLLERVSVNRDLFEKIYQPGLKPEVDLTLGIHGTRSFGRITASAAVDITHTSNRFYRQGENRWLTSLRTGLQYAL